MSLPLPPVPFYFLRHGVTDHNLRRLVAGRLDVPLNDQGRRQAAAAAGLLAGLGIRRILASPLSRARETAEIVATKLGSLVMVIEGLQERDWGEFTGRTHRELMRKQYRTPPGAETAQEFSARILSAMTGMTEPGPVLLVAHSGACRVLRRALLIDDGEGPVPNAVPLLFAPKLGGGWQERAILAPVARV